MRRRRRSSTLVACAAAAAILTACVGPARSYGSYEGKAGATADDMRSAVETASFAVANAAADKAPAPFVAVALSDAEEDASAIQGAFDSIQPPNLRADDLRDQLDELLTKAVSILSELRIAARRGELDELSGIAEPLEGLSDDLDRFAEAHA